MEFEFLLGIIEQSLLIAATLRNKLQLQQAKEI